MRWKRRRSTSWTGASACGFALPAESLAAVAVPTLVVWGGASHPAVQRVNALLSRCVAGAASATVAGAAHFMSATHAGAVASLIAGHVRGGGKGR
jgi:pimeloyl-ACP methyl ester carboxylesterase